MAFGLGNITNILTGGATRKKKKFSLGDLSPMNIGATAGGGPLKSMKDEFDATEKERKGAEERKDTAAMATEAEATKVRLAKEKIKQKRLVLGRRGQRSTRRSGATPDLFATSGGATKTLLG